MACTGVCKIVFYVISCKENLGTSIHLYKYVVNMKLKSPSASLTEMIHYN